MKNPPNSPTVGDMPIFPFAVPADNEKEKFYEDWMTVFIKRVSFDA